jgi:hypothetical protein
MAWMLCGEKKMSMVYMDVDTDADADKVSKYMIWRWARYDGERLCYSFHSPQTRFPD